MLVWNNNNCPVNSLKLHECCLLLFPCLFYVLMCRLVYMLALSDVLNISMNVKSCQGCDVSYLFLPFPFLTFSQFLSLCMDVNLVSNETFFVCVSFTSLTVIP